MQVSFIYLLLSLVLSTKIQFLLPQSILYLWEIWFQVTQEEMVFTESSRQNGAKHVGICILSTYTTEHSITSFPNYFSLPLQLRLPSVQNTSKMSLLCKEVMLNRQIWLWQVTNLTEHQNITPLWWKCSSDSLKICRTTGRYRAIKRSELLQMCQMDAKYFIFMLVLI